MVTGSGKICCSAAKSFLAYNSSLHTAAPATYSASVELSTCNLIDSTPHDHAAPAIITTHDAVDLASGASASAASDIAYVVLKNGSEQSYRKHLHLVVER